MVNSVASVRPLGILSVPYVRGVSDIFKRISENVDIKTFFKLYINLVFDRN
jgi:hypothetical protein